MNKVATKLHFKCLPVCLACFDFNVPYYGLGDKTLNSTWQRTAQLILFILKLFKVIVCQKLKTFTMFMDIAVVVHNWHVKYSFQDFICGFNCMSYYAPFISYYSELLRAYYNGNYYNTVSFVYYVQCRYTRILSYCAM